MLADHATHPHARTRLIIADVVGLLIGILAFFRVAIPVWGLLPAFAQLSPPARLLVLVKLLSPLISLLLAGGWAWVLLWIGDLVWSARAHRTEQFARQARGLGGRSAFSPSTQVPLARHPVRTQQRMAASPLFQLDPAHPERFVQSSALTLPVTPLPATDPAWTSDEQGEERSQEPGEETNEDAQGTAAEQALPSEVVDVPKPAQQEHGTPSEETNEDAQETAAEQALPLALVDLPKSAQQAHNTPTTPTGTPQEFSLHASGSLAQTASPIAISLLKQVHVELLTADGARREVKLRRGEHGIRLILLAYIAWRKGQPVDRDKLLTYVLARGRRRDMDTDQLGEVFDAAKKYLREDLKKAITELNREAGHEQIAEKTVDFFSTEPGFYWLHQACRVVDLEALEQHYQPIRLARKDGRLDEKVDGSLPPWVIESCQQLISAYAGDFLADLIEKFPDEFGAWVKEPFTLYRDMYLDALWIMATYERAQGRHFVDLSLTAAQNEESRRHHQARAAQLYGDYALYAINSRVDAKLKFAYRAGKDGERVIMSERAIRRCAVELGKIGKAEEIDQVYLTFKDKMQTLSEGNWKPQKETESDVAEAKKVTSAYRFSAQLPGGQDPPNQNPA